MISYLSNTKVEYKVLSNGFKMDDDYRNYNNHYHDHNHTNSHKTGMCK